MRSSARIAAKHYLLTCWGCHGHRCPVVDLTPAPRRDPSSSKDMGAMRISLLPRSQERQTCALDREITIKHCEHAAKRKNHTPLFLSMCPVSCCTSVNGRNTNEASGVSKLCRGRWPPCAVVRRRVYATATWMMRCNKRGRSHTPLCTPCPDSDPIPSLPLTFPCVPRVPSPSPTF